MSLVNERNAPRFYSRRRRHRQWICAVVAAAACAGHAPQPEPTLQRVGALERPPPCVVPGGAHVIQAKVSELALDGGRFVVTLDKGRAAGVETGWLVRTDFLGEGASQKDASLFAPR